MSRERETRHELSDADRRLLDALVESGFDPAGLEGLGEAERQRAEVLTNLFGLLDDYPVEDADETLIHATLARVDRHEAERAARMSFDLQQAEEAAGRRRLIRIPDFVSVAAVILIVASVALPVMSQLRERSIDSGCANNLRLVGYGFSNYAADFDGMMPMARAGFGRSWDQADNFLNLAPLIDGEYCELGCLSCPGHDDLATESYSYRWQSPDAPVSWEGARVTVVLGRGDNIWLPDGTSRLIRGTRPADAGDVFLAH